MLKLGISPGYKKILLACSGGLDSTALLRSLYSCGFNIQVAHVNFKLREEESEQNEAFVSGLCNSLGIPLYVTSFETQRLLLESNSRNLQEFARELRYQWFEELLIEHKLDFIATAHHADDQSETLINNFIRGSALKGLSGISFKRDHVIRPFLNFSREEILHVSKMQEWEHSTDSSNEKNYYTRNFIRNKIMPLLKEINPSITDTLQRQAELYSKFAAYLNWSANNAIKDLLVQQNENSKDLNIDKLRSIPGYAVLLFEYLRELEFTNDQVHQITSAIDSNETGLLLYSNTHKLLVDRTVLKVLKKSGEDTSTRIIWENNADTILLPDENVLIRRIKEPDSSNAQYMINVDLKLLKQKLFLRHWKKGDLFYPKGMNDKRKKLSDYFIDAKINRFDKDKIWLLVNEKEEIIWIVGLRQDNRFLPESAKLSCWIYLDKRFQP